MRQMPICITMEGKRCVVFGGGKVALRRAELLLSYGAEVLVVAERIAPAFQTTKAQCRREPYHKRWLEGCFLTVAATSDSAVNAQIVADAREAGVLCNRADKGMEGDFTIPAQKTEGEVTVAVSTNGAYPKLGAKLCRETELTLYAKRLPQLEKYRALAIERIPDREKRNSFLEELLKPAILKGAFSQKADQLLERYCHETSD